MLRKQSMPTFQYSCEMGVFPGMRGDYTNVTIFDASSSRAGSSAGGGVRALGKDFC